MDTYDVIIIGGGASALSAGLYSARYNMATLIIMEELGGETATAATIENYPGYKSIDGYDLITKMHEQVGALGVKMVTARAESVSRENHCFTVTAGGEEHRGKSLILAVGRERRKLGIPREDELRGRGVSYCATCDGPLFGEGLVGMVGGGDSAVKGAILLSQYVSEVFVIYRGEQLSSEPINLERLSRIPKVKILYKTQVKELLGENELKGVVLDNPYNGNDRLELDGLFVEIGADPRDELARSLGVELDERNYIIVDNMMRTNVDGVFASGDVTNASGDLKQVITSAAQGVLAATSAYKDVIEHGHFCETHARGFVLPQV